MESQIMEFVKPEKKRFYKNNKEAIAYYSISSVNSEEAVSVEHQMKYIYDYSLKNNINVIAGFKDMEGGELEGRKGFWSAMDYIDKNKVDIFIVWNYDVLHKNLKETLIFVDMLKEKGIGYISINQMINTDTLQGKRFFKILSTFKEYEKEVVRERIKEERLNRINKIIDPSKLTFFGYDTHWKVDEAKAPVVRNIFDSYLKLRNLRELSKFCKEARYDEILGTTLGVRNLKNLLQNRIYTGEVLGKDKDGEKLIWKSHHKPIIDKELFGKVQCKLDWN